MFQGATKKGEVGIKHLYRVKFMGQYHFFKTEEAMSDYLATLDEVSRKYAEAETFILGGMKK